jgi:hypothetical protein
MGDRYKDFYNSLSEAQLASLRQKQQQAIQEKEAFAATMREINEYAGQVIYDTIVRESKEKANEILRQESQIENQKEIIRLLSKEKIKPAWKAYLIDKNLIYPDGKRVVKSLDDVACYLRDYINKDDDGKEIKFDWKFLQESFLQYDGSSFAEKTCRDAVRMSNYTLNTP